MHVRSCGTVPPTESSSSRAAKPQVKTLLQIDQVDLRDWQDYGMDSSALDFMILSYSRPEEELDTALKETFPCQNQAERVEYLSLKLCS